MNKRAKFSMCLRRRANLIATDLVVHSPGDVPSQCTNTSSHLGLERAIVEMHATMKQQQADKDTNKWKSQLPSVTIKASYAHLVKPTPRGDAATKAIWPRRLLEDAIPLPAFSEYLVTQKNTKKDHRENQLRGAGRVLDMLEANGGPLDHNEPGMDIKVLLGLYTERTHTQLLNLPILRPVYTWSLKTIDAFISYCEFHARQVSQKMILDGDEYLSKYKTVLEELVKDLRGGHRKRCVEQHDKDLLARRRHDREQLKNITTPDELRRGVEEGYRVLAFIHKQYRHADSLPEALQAEANSILIGSIWCSSFGGRKKEWETMPLATALGMLERDEDFLIVTEHKTSTTYGDLAKWLPAGLLTCLKHYLQLPRRPSVSTMLHPVRDGTDVVNVPKALKLFHKRHLPKKTVAPTVNLMRKWFHTALMKATDSKDKLKEVMTLLDAHRSGVQSKHYYLRDPADDTILAKHLVKLNLGDTAAWPVEDEKGLDNEVRGAIENLMARTGDCDDKETEDDEAEDEDPLEWWDAAGDFFGITRPDDFVPLGDADAVFEAVDHVDTKESGRACDVVSESGRVGSDTHARRKRQRATLEEEASQTHSCQQQHAADTAALAKELREYACPIAGISGTRNRVDTAAHQWMLEQLKAWQHAHGVGHAERPTAKEWYLHKRVEAIKSGLLSQLHSDDVVRSFIRNHIGKMKRGCGACDTVGHAICEFDGG